MKAKDLPFLIESSILDQSRRDELSKITEFTLKRGETRLSGKDYEYWTPDAKVIDCIDTSIVNNVLLLIKHHKWSGQSPLFSDFLIVVGGNR